VNGTDAVTLGHGIDLGAEFCYSSKRFGSQEAIEELQKHPGWNVGLIEHNGLAPDMRSEGELRQAMFINSFVSMAQPMTIDAVFLENLHSAAMEHIGVETRLRTIPVFIHGAKHMPPEASMVPSLVKKYCEVTNSLLAERTDPWTLGAYCLWWVNTVHPFTDGNGRTARGLAYWVIAMAFGKKVSPLWHEPFERELRRQYFLGLQAVNEACGNCSCCGTSMRREFTGEAVASLAQMLQSVISHRQGD